MKLQDLLLSVFFVAQKTILQYIKDSLNGLAYVHAKGLIHLDIKPTNILVSVDSTVALAIIVHVITVIIMITIWVDVWKHLVDIRR